MITFPSLLLLGITLSRRSPFWLLRSRDDLAVAADKKGEVILRLCRARADASSMTQRAAKGSATQRDELGRKHERFPNAIKELDEHSRYTNLDFRDPTAR